MQSTGLRGITIQEPYLSQILTGSKQWEYRRYDLPSDYRNVPVLLLSKSAVRGYVIFAESKKLASPETLILEGGRRYTANYAWKISKAGPLKHAARYLPSGFSLVRNVAADVDITEESFG